MEAQHPKQGHSVGLGSPLVTVNIAGVTYCKASLRFQFLTFYFLPGILGKDNKGTLCPMGKTSKVPDTLWGVRKSLPFASTQT